METRDPYLHGHSRRVARYAWMIAQQMKLPHGEVAKIRTAAALHDVGKSKTPKAILHKPGRLTDEEYGVIKLHPGEGAEMVAVLGDPELEAMVRHHHERLDGSGYPDGLAGEAIPLGARIISVADTFDAITSARPYRAASPHKRAIDILRDDAGSRLDPAAVKAFCDDYSGRRPLALWAIVCGLPDRLLDLALDERRRRRIGRQGGRRRGAGRHHRSGIVARHRRRVRRRRHTIGLRRRPRVPALPPRPHMQLPSRGARRRATSPRGATRSVTRAGRRSGCRPPSPARPPRRSRQPPAHRRVRGRTKPRRRTPAVTATTDRALP